MRESGQWAAPNDDCQKSARKRNQRSIIDCIGHKEFIGNGETAAHSGVHAVKNPKEI